MSPCALYEELIASWDLHRIAAGGTGEYQVLTPSGPTSGTLCLTLSVHMVAPLSSHVSQWTRGWAGQPGLHILQEEASCKGRGVTDFQLVNWTCPPPQL